jgi:hypothetical protein
LVAITRPLNALVGHQDVCPGAQKEDRQVVLPGVEVEIPYFLIGAEVVAVELGRTPGLEAGEGGQRHLSLGSALGDVDFHLVFSISFL